MDLSDVMDVRPRDLDHVMLQGELVLISPFDKGPALVSSSRRGAIVVSEPRRTGALWVARLGVTLDRSSDDELASILSLIFDPARVLTGDLETLASEAAILLGVVGLGSGKVLVCQGQEGHLGTFTCLAVDRGVLPDGVDVAFLGDPFGYLYQGGGWSAYAIPTLRRAVFARCSSSDDPGRRGEPGGGGAT